MAKRILILVLVFSTMTAWAQQPGAEEVAMGPRKQLATIIFAGLGGAVLGLSTLSFYGRPQEKLSNIAVGFALGIIGGAVYTTYKTATRPYDGYNYPTGGSLLPEFESQRELYLAQQKASELGVNWQWEF